MSGKGIQSLGKPTESVTEAVALIERGAFGHRGQEKLGQEFHHVANETTFIGLRTRRRIGSSLYLVFLWSQECCKLPWDAGVKWEERICISPDAREHDL